MQVYLQAFPGAQHSENPIKALCCFRTGARAGGSARATCHSLSPRGENKNSEGLTHEWVTQEGAHGNGRKEHNTREKRLHNGPQCSSANFPRVILSAFFLLFCSLPLAVPFPPPSISNSNLFLPAWGSLINVNWYASSSSSLSSPNAVMLG